jgi:hypothetical protein
MPESPVTTPNYTTPWDMIRSSVGFVSARPWDELDLK